MTDSGMRNGAIAMAVDTVSSLASLVFDGRVNARPLPARHREVVLSAIFSPPKIIQQQVALSRFWEDANSGYNDAASPKRVVWVKIFLVN